MKIFMTALIVALIMVLVFLITDKVKGQKSKKRNGLTNSSPSKEKNRKELVDYRSYAMTKKEYLIYFLSAGAALYLMSYIFYQNSYISFVFALFSFFYPKLKKKDLAIRRKQELLLQFKQALYSLSSSLVAGKSIENAFKETVNDMKMLYPNTDTFIIQEFSIINRRVENGEPIEKAIEDFSIRADSEDITSFSDVFITSKKTGGDTIEIIRKTANIISEKIEIKQEISIMIAQKQFEAKILSIAPFAIIALVSFSSPDYMEPMYQLGIGSIIMTISFMLLGFSYWLSKWIMEIKV